ncbi:MAG: hypothetical protein M1274_15525, partial [Actinobacteria bacterium]|nr:hypothetical protein [Actinomycetota bacterium]
GVDHYIPVEKLFQYEYGAPFRFNDATRERLMMEVAGEDFETGPLPGRIILDDLERLVGENPADLRTPEGFARFVEKMADLCPKGQEALEGLRRFCWIDPRLPDPASKTFLREQAPLGLRPDMGRADIIARLESIRRSNELADLAFYAYRDLGRTESAPFLKAALERSPVSLAATADMDDGAVIADVQALPEESIYDEAGRLAQPDEVWNFGRGDGVEKAVLAANILMQRHPGVPVTIEISTEAATLQFGSSSVRFPTTKELTPQVWDCRAV